MEIRRSDPTLLAEATSSYNDWRGTAVAEDSMIQGSGDLYELAGLADERDRWSILALEMYAFSHGADPKWRIDVYAADRHELGVQSYEDWDRVVEEHGGIPVFEISLHDASADDVLKCMKFFSVQLRGGRIHHPLLQAGQGDHPPQY